MISMSSSKLFDFNMKNRKKIEKKHLWRFLMEFPMVQSPTLSVTTDPHVKVNCNTKELSLFIIFMQLKLIFKSSDF